MKNLLILIAFVSFQAHAILVLDIKGTSFSVKGNRTTELTYTFQDSGTVELGTTQFLKLEARNSFTSSDRLIITIQHVNDNNTLSKNDTLLNVQFYKIWDSVQFDNDGTKKIQFQLPVDYQSGKFLITNNKSSDKAYGVIATPTGIEDDLFYSKTEIKEVFYFDVNGVKINDPNNYEGVMIRKILFTDNKVRVEKILLRF
jgi:hypothetical protein